MHYHFTEMSATCPDCTNIVEDVAQTRPRQACVSLTCPRHYQHIPNVHICLDLPPTTLSAYKKS